MKTLKTFLSVFAIAAVFSTGSFAQVNVTATAEVNAAYTVATTTNIDLGTIQTGLTSTIKANTNDGATEANLGSGATAGQVDITGGTASASVTVDFTNATLDNGSDALTFTTVVYNGVDAVTSGSSINLDGSGNAQLDLGGTLAAPSGTGTYNTSTGSGSPITVTITYD